MKAHPSAPSVARYRRPDDPLWHWLEERDSVQVKDFLNAANLDCQHWFKPLSSLSEALYQGHLARRELAVTGLATPLDHYAYWSETAADADYPVLWRHPLGAGLDHHDSERCGHQCLIDLQALARDEDFLELGDIVFSEDEQWMAWTLDTRGDEFFDLWLRHLPDGEARRLESGIGPELCWAEDNATLLFTRYDDTQRPATVWRRHRDETSAVQLYEERDAEFWVGLGKTRSRQWLVISSASRDTSESHLIPAAAPATEPRCFRPRQSGVEYAIDHRPGTFYVLHNRAGPHFRVDIAAENAFDHWQVLIEHRDDTTIEEIDTFAWGLVLTERDHTTAQVHLRLLEPDAAHSLQRDEWLPIFEMPCSLALADNPHFHERRLRLHEESFTTPPRWVEIDLDSGARQVLRQQPVHGDLAPEKLACRRLWATACDGERVPVSIVARADLIDSGTLPTLLYGYGAYGQTLDPWFSISRLELLARGAAFAVAHVRGGGDRGEPWYLAGKLAHKENSFRDFLAARNLLVEQGFANERHIAAYGASAGGLLVAASVNLDPDAFCAVVLDVPFVDVLRTMENPELPLTTAEYSEWGDPREPEAQQRIQGYSPLDNLAPVSWPAVYLQGSWHDTRVPYWEPAKLYARLLEMNRARGPVLLHTDMTAGHGGASGRFHAWRDVAQQDAFILWALGMAERERAHQGGDAP
ncbi:S9 family peptidase [Kushneria aurantia]|uniref:S9 family peptidase n=1 Tax=Kushneria aurantia TaxID=504092 RepID=A0ABV6G8E9_9GAMM|nr:prolyl oligopeptidase family serine peptidase [Kushneria aurantia]